MADVKSPEAKVVEFKEKLLSEMFASYASIGRDSANPSTYFMWNNETGEYKYYFLRVCHADMRYSAAGIKPDEMITGIPFTDEIDLTYQRMLLSGPFRAVADHIALKFGGPKDKYAYSHITDLATFPANVLNNYIIATRLPIEHSHLLPMFGTMLEKGYDETFSLLLSFSRSGKIDGPRTMALGATNTNHMWFDPSSSWKNLLSGSFENPSKPFKGNPMAIIPANVIWGYDPSMALKLRNIGDDAEIAEIFGVGLNKALPEPYVPGRRPPRPAKAKINAINIIGQAGLMANFQQQVAAAQAAGEPMVVDIEAHPQAIPGAPQGFQFVGNNWVNMGQHPPQPPAPLQWQDFNEQPHQPEVDDIDDDDEDLDEFPDDIDDDF